MKKALICPNEPVDFFDGKTGYRVAQTEPSENIFSVGDPLYWVDCADEVAADVWYFDPDDAIIKVVPVRAPQPSTPIGNAPNVIA